MLWQTDLSRILWSATVRTALAMSLKASNGWIRHCCYFWAYGSIQKSINILGHDLATTHYAGATADLFAEVEVPLVASEMNLQSSLSRGQSSISHVLNQEIYHGGWTTSSDQIWAWIVKDVEEIDPPWLQKFGRSEKSECEWQASIVEKSSGGPEAKSWVRHRERGE